MMNGVRRSAALLVLATVMLLLQSSVTPAHAQRASVRAHLDSTVYLLGDRIIVHVDVFHTPGLTLQPLVGDSLAGFTVLGQSGVQKLTDSTARAEFVLAKYDSGDATIPSMPFMFFLPGDTASHYAHTNELQVTITTVPPDTTQDIKDLRPIMSLPLAWEDIGLYGGILLVVLALAFFGYRSWKKRKAAKGDDGYVPPPRPAHAIAIEELGALKAKKLWQAGHVKEYYSELTEILRRYFENRYAMPALEETTDEIMEGLRKLRPGAELLHSTESVLRMADLVKFAKHTPSMSEHEQAMEAVYVFVDRTKIVEMTPVVTAEKGADNVAS
jgi:hypothetical protein